MNTFQVQFISPNNQILFDKVISLSANGLEGEFVVLVNHSSHLIYLLPGIVVIRMNRKLEKVVIGSGIMKIIASDCTIFSNQIQIFNRIIHNEKSLKRKGIDVQLNYYFN
ncbi:MAG: F0F1 ATP synthase subunit epsilon [Wolbachia endosymbiont of Menacanthus eurysternus]|nr:MAG: F0F1 ATP synthase subunit epsilon [Wolbachia endosymbiont of Menacanthus eurysternus]